MMNINFKMKKIYYLYIGVFILIITNPTLKDFREGTFPNIAVSGKNVNNTLSFRKADFILFSEYQNIDGTYIGVLKNFFKFNSSTMFNDTTKTDTLFHVR
jgi:hypothetical protein